MEKQNELNVEYFFDNEIDIKNAYRRILDGENDNILFRDIAKNYVKQNTLLLTSHDKTEKLKASQNVEFNRLTGKYYSTTCGYVYYTSKSVGVLPLVNLSEKWRGIIILVYHNNMISFEDLKEIIERMQIKLEIDMSAVEGIYKKIKDRSLYGDAFTFVQGIKPIDGSVAKVVLDIQVELIPGLESTDGSMDFKERNFVHNVSEGERIGHYIKAIESENGIDIYEQPIEAHFDEDPNYTLGENIALADNGVDIISTSNGIIVISEDNVLSVDNTLEVNRIDLAIGNIDIQGTIVIKENVAPGFKIMSESDIIVHGNVEDCLISSKGNLAVSGGILGGITSDIRVAGDVYASSVRNAKIFAQGDVTVANQIINSNIIANGRVIVLEGKGTIVGGTISAKKGIYAKVLGSVTDSSTILIAGKDIENETRYKRIVQNIKDNQAEIARSKALLGNEYLRNPKLFLDKLNTGKKLEAYNLIDKIDILTSELKQMETERKEIYALFENITGSIISIERTIFPGVIVQIGVNKRVITQQITGTQFFYHEASRSIFVKSPIKLTEKEYNKFDDYVKHLKKPERKKENTDDILENAALLEQNPDNMNNV